ncbi:MAG: D-alanyl-D-alanine carboxypeptidase [Selenomonadaceae bacterium]|nr:D-alanyl-D-alanine carboxypeptidase [Selenomonadaceae bacterium]
MRILLMMLVMLFSVSVAAAQPVEPIIQADAAILIESGTGRVIYEKNADQVRPPASMTKMMTCILGLEQLPRKTLIPLSNAAVYAEDNSFQWKPGDVMQADELLLGMMMVSDNGAAIAVAQAVSGSVPQFAAAMNEKAAELGCTNTNFVNPNGLPNRNHYSTARDMAKIAMYGMKMPDFRKIVSAIEEPIHWSSPSNKMDVAITTNEMLEYYTGMNGIKTGWTNAAGGCFAGSAMRGSTELIAIIMHSPDTRTRFDDTAKLLDYGFDVVKMTKVLNKDRVSKIVFVQNGVQATVHVRPLEDLNFPLLDGEDTKKLKIVYELPEMAEAPIRQGKTLGYARLKYDGEVVASVPMIAEESVERGFSVLSKLVGFAAPVVTIAQNVLGAFFA